MAAVSRIHPFLWFDGGAEEAARFYVSIFPNSRIVHVEKIATGPAEGGAIVEFELEGQRFGGVDGGPMCPNACPQPVQGRRTPPGAGPGLARAR